VPNALLCKEKILSSMGKNAIRAQKAPNKELASMFQEMIEVKHKFKTTK